MSVRQTAEIASEASRFSLRTIFPASFTTRAAPPPPPQSFQPQTLTPTHAPVQNPIAQNSQLRFNLPLHNPQSPPSTGLSPENVFKFSLPVMNNNSSDKLQRTTLNPSFGEVAASMENSNSGEFRATALTGMNSGGNTANVNSTSASPEGVSDTEVALMFKSNADLSEKLRNCESQLEKTANSVTRGNTALSTERAQFKQKILSLNAETSVIREREKNAIIALEMREDQNATISELKVLVKNLQAQLITSANVQNALEHTSTTLKLEVSKQREKQTEVSQDYIQLESEFDSFRKSTFAKSQEASSEIASANAIIKSHAAEVASFGHASLQFQKDLKQTTSQAKIMEDEIKELKTTVSSGEHQIDSLDTIIADLRAANICAHCPTPIPPHYKPDGAGTKDDGSGTATPTPDSNPDAEPDSDSDSDDAAAVSSSVLDQLPTVVRISSCCADMEGGCEDAKDEEAVKDARKHLSKQMHDNPFCMGISSAGDTDTICLHTFTNTGAVEGVLQPQRIVKTTSINAAMRTNAYVMAVSEDIKRRMTGQRALWVKTAAIGSRVI